MKLGRHSSLDRGTIHVANKTSTLSHISSSIETKPRNRLRVPVLQFLQKTIKPCSTNETAELLNSLSLESTSRKSLEPMEPTVIGEIYDLTSSCMPLNLNHPVRTSTEIRKSTDSVDDLLNDIIKGYPPKVTPYAQMQEPERRSTMENLFQPAKIFFKEKRANARTINFKTF